MVGHSSAGCATPQYASAPGPSGYVIGWMGVVRVVYRHQGSSVNPREGNLFHDPALLRNHPNTRTRGKEFAKKYLDQTQDKGGQWGPV